MIVKLSNLALKFNQLTNSVSALWFSRNHTNLSSLVEHSSLPSLEYWIEVTASLCGRVIPTMCQRSASLQSVRI